MTKKDINYTDNLQNALDYQSGFTSDDDKLKVLVEACKDFLQSLKYRIIDPPRLKYRGQIKSINDLIILFYEGIDTHGAKEFSVYRNQSRDLGIAKQFVESRQELCDLSYEEALAECAEIIHTILEDQLEGNKVIGDLKLSFKLFVPSERTGWIIESAIELMNSKKYRANEALTERLTEAYLEEIGEESLAWEDIDEIYEEIVNGKEKTN